MEYSNLETEKRNSVSANLDQMSTIEAVTLMNQIDGEVITAVQKTIPDIARVVETAVDAFQNGGRLIYCGAGTSGRLGVLDASECLPTFGVSPDMVVGRIAGGDNALRFAIEGAEDDAQLGARDMEQLDVGENDLVIAISAGGRAEYCLGALRFAKSNKSKTAGIVCVTDSPFSEYCDCMIKALTGPEILTGSTRLKAGTATKMILNMISTLSMVQIGKVYKNYMVDVVPTNKKLNDRAIRIIMDTCKLDREKAENLLSKCNGEIKTAIVCYETRESVGVSRDALAQTNGFVRKAINFIKN